MTKTVLFWRILERLERVMFLRLSAVRKLKEFTVIPFSRVSLHNWQCSQHVYLCNLLKTDMTYTSLSCIKPGRGCSY